MSNKKENLRELLGKFYDAEQAKAVAEDISRGEQVFDEKPAPEPGEELLADIRTKIARELKYRRRRNFGRFILRTASVAAVFLIVATVSHRVINKRQTLQIAEKNRTSEVIWESDDLTIDDADLSILAAQVEELAEEILTLKVSANGADSIGVDELEMELLAISNDFWKG